MLTCWPDCRRAGGGSTSGCSETPPFAVAARLPLPLPLPLVASSKVRCWAPVQIPCDPKLLLPPYNKEELAAFKLTELEKDLKKVCVLLGSAFVHVGAAHCSARPAAAASCRRCSLPYDVPRTRR